MQSIRDRQSLCHHLKTVNKTMKKTLLTTTLILAFLLNFSTAFAQEDTGADAQPATANGALSGGFTLIPAYPNTINPRKFIFELKPGSKFTDYILVRNLSGTESSFKFYGADPTVSNQGTPAYKTTQNGGDGEGQWITFEEPVVTLTGGAMKVLKFTINIPENAPTGDHRVGIAMEKTQKDSKNANITIATRVILHAEIKVTNNPQVIPRENKPPQPEEKTLLPSDLSSEQWQPIYFWGSIVLVLAALGFLLWATKAEKKTAPHKTTKARKTSRKKKK